MWFGSVSTAGNQAKPILEDNGGRVSHLATCLNAEVQRFNDPRPRPRILPLPVNLFREAF